MKFSIKPGNKQFRIMALGAAVLLVMTSIGACRSASPKYAGTVTNEPAYKTGIVSFDVSITPETGGDIRLWLPYPTSNEYQLVENVAISGNYDEMGIYREPGSGSIILYAEWKAPAGPAILDYSFEVARQEIIRKDFKSGGDEIPVELEKYLTATSLGPTAGSVKQTAEEITRGKNTILEKATAIYDWIIDTFRRDPEIAGCGIGDVELLLQTQAGKCTDISSVFVALARSVGVPAREIFGIRIGAEGDITSAYHCRGEFYLPEYGWVPVDPSDVRKFMLNNGCGLDSEEVNPVRDYYFGAQNETYIDFYTGRDMMLVPRQSSGPLNYLMYPYAEAGGRALDWFAQQELKYTVTFEGA